MIVSDIPKFKRPSFCELDVTPLGDPFLRRAKKRKERRSRRRVEGRRVIGGSRRPVGEATAGDTLKPTLSLPTVNVRNSSPHSKTVSGTSPNPSYHSETSNPLLK
eukprot:Selendium_serpulae@DN5901_c0_g1_i8.p1